MTTEINTLADIKDYKYRMKPNAPAHGCIPAMLEEILDLRSYAARQEAEKLALLDRLEEQSAELKGANLDLALTKMAVESEKKTLASAEAYIAGLEAKIAASQQGSEPVAWLSEDGKRCISAADKMKMETCNFGHWAEIATRYATPLYTHPIAPADKAVLSRGDAGSAFVVPEGYALVPLEITIDMAVAFAGREVIEHAPGYSGVEEEEELKLSYSRMIAAATKEDD